MKFRLNLHLACRITCPSLFCEMMKGAGVTLLTVGTKFVFLTTVAAVEFQSKRSKKGRNEGLHVPSQEDLFLSMQCLDLFFVLRTLIYPVEA